MNNQTTEAVSVEIASPDIAIVKMDLPGTGANILNDQLFAELDQTMESLAENRDLKGVILFSAKPKIFVAGADLNKIVATLDWPDKEIIKFCEKGRAVMARFSRCPFVSVAAIHGACVGGGLELALWCDHRIASDDRRTVLGLPEVKLGLVPGWAGTARLPRIIGFEPAAELVTSGKLVSSGEAKTLGFVDAVVPQDKLIEEAAAMARRVRTSESFIRDRRAIMGPVSDTDDLSQSVLKIGTQIVEQQGDTYPFAPTVALEHMARTAELPIKDAWNSESHAMAQVYGSPASRGLLNNFFLVDRNKKNAGLVDTSLTPNKIESVGIVGAGVMGKLIAENCLKRGIHVLIHDAADGAAETVADALAEHATKANIKPTSNLDEFKEVQLVIESVVETFEVKKLVLTKIESAINSNTIIASNTSAIPIEKLAAVVDRPENLCGIHFCHPELMSLVEVIAGPDTSEQTITSAVAFVRGLGKMPVAMNDGPGFVVNRLLAAMIDQSLRLFSAGLSIESIDQAMRDFGFQGGPFEIIDVIGADTCMYAGRTMWEGGLRCVSLSPILPKMVKNDWLGRKKGRGFYQYSDPCGKGVFDNALLETIGGYRSADPAVENMEPEEISNWILSAIALEATNILDDEIVSDFRDIDLCIIHGFSFPQHQGGILFWADQFGWDNVQSRLLQIVDMKDESSNQLRPNESVKKLADKRSRLYS